MKTKEEIATGSLLYTDCPDWDYVDRYEYAVEDSQDRIGLLDAAGALVGPGPRWVEGLFALRNRIASVFRLKTPVSAERKEGCGRTWDVGTRAGIFSVFARTADEIVLGEDDSHLNFRVSLLLKRDGTRKTVAVTTAVRLNNRLGRCYFLVVKPFHRVIVPAVMKRNFGRLERKFRAGGGEG